MRHPHPPLFDARLADLTDLGFPGVATALHVANVEDRLEHAIPGLAGMAADLGLFTAADPAGAVFADLADDLAPPPATPAAFSPLGVDLFGDPRATPGAGILASRFIVPPMSVLNAREGDWQARKRAWIATGITSEVGRGDALTHNTRDWFAEHGKSGAESSTSVFDPVLCELAYAWFSPPGGHVLDPFAGGSVRGIVAACMGRRYTGIELSGAQVAANRAGAAAAAIPPHAPAPAWIHGDAAAVFADPMARATTRDADLVFSCPPYGDLERYSDDPADLSTMAPDAFEAAYRRIIAGAVERLRPDRFAVFVVGDYRDGKGRLRDFPATTIKAFRDAGADFYNEIVLVTAIGSLSIRVAKQFAASRKIGKTHQNVLVFVNGDARRATAALDGNA